MTEAPQLIEPGHLAEKVLAAAGDRGRIGLVMDYYGTLVPILPRPEDAVADEGLIGLLTDLSTHARLVVTVVSGRSLEDLHRVLPVPATMYRFGGHGGEGEGPRFRAFTTWEDSAVLKMIKSITRHLEDESWPEGVWLERKGMSLALHFRQASPKDGEAARSRFRNLVGRLGGEGKLEIIAGRKVLEVRPRGLHKGLAIEWLRQNLRPAPEVLVYAGDDTTDEEGFRALDDGDFPVLVGAAHRATAARYRVSDSDALRRFLEDLAEKLFPEGR